MFGVGDIAKELIRRLGTPDDFSLNVRETPTEKLQAMWREINLLGAFDEATRLRAEAIRDELLQRQKMP